MKLNSTRNLIVLIALWLVTAGAGSYVTFVQQPQELDHVQKAEEVARLKQGEVGTLLAEAATSEKAAIEVLGQWDARYKIVPSSVASPEVVGYLNRLTSEGFKTFDVNLVGVESKGDYSYYTYEATGRAYFNSLYRFVWDVENNRVMYRIRELTIDHTDVLVQDAKAKSERMEVMVSFTMKIDAFFGGLNGMSADSLGTPTLPAVTAADGAKLPPVPAGVLAASRPATNPFFPVVMRELPPNTYNLLDIAEATLVGIVGGKAVFETKDDGYVRLGSGDPVYLGQITQIDPIKGLVTARLNKGGIVDEVEMVLNTEDPFRQARGKARLTPADRQ